MRPRSSRFKSIATYPSQMYRQAYKSQTAMKPKRALASLWAAKALTMTDLFLGQQPGHQDLLISARISSMVAMWATGRSASTATSWVLASKAAQPSANSVTA